jgi:hypothetical protein
VVSTQSTTRYVKTLFFFFFFFKIENGCLTNTNKIVAVWEQQFVYKRDFIYNTMPHTTS